MQQVPQMLFCEECGLANDLTASHCASCHHPLTHASDTLSPSPIAPITVAPRPVMEVTPGPLFIPGQQNPGTQPKPPSVCDFRPGSLLIERYQIQEEIGRGGFSLVYRAIDLDMNRRDVAIKRIPLHTLTPRQILDATETFNREITMLTRLKGVYGIPRLYEHLTDAENWCLILQYIPGQTLEEYLQQVPGGHLNEEETIEIGIALTRILQALHYIKPPVIFRDVKPANILMTPQRELFLIDFGIARNYTPGKKKDTTPLGSPGYAPPEQYGRSQTDRRADIYSLGATLQTLLTGRDPLELRAGKPSRNPQSLSRRLRTLLDHMLSPVATKRPSDMRRIRRRLEGLRLFPLPSYVAGSIVGLALSGLLALDLFTGFGRFTGGTIGLLLVMVTNLSPRLVKKTFQIKSAKWVLWSYAFLGALIGLLPLLFIWLWHVFV